MLNKVFLIGNLGADPEMRYLPSGETVANIRVATTEVYKDKAGQRVEETEWHRVSFFGRQAETIGQYLKKGGQIHIEGKIKTRKWKDKEGKDQYTTEIKGIDYKMLGNRGGENRSTSPADTGAPAAAPVPAQANGGKLDDDIPFSPLRGLHF
jgi:single-strand DNA-binding protein